MRILVGCEESQIVTQAFRRRGHDAYSCDILSTRGDSAYHITGDVFKAIRERGPWDALIVFPPCTHVAVSGARWFKNKIAEQRQALEFMRDLLECDIPLIRMENPISVFSSYWRKPDEIVQPWNFGRWETKAFCFWTKGLPKLAVKYRTKEECRIALGLPEGSNPHARVHRMAPSPNRARDRSETLPEIAEAIAEQMSSI